MVPRLDRLLLALAGVLLASLPDAVAAQVMSEYRAKAFFIHNVLSFVEWPEAALAPNAPIEIAVLGRPAGDEVQAALVGMMSRRHSLQVHVYDRAADIPGCHVLFVTVDGAGDMRAALRAFDGKPVLTIADGHAGGLPGPAITLLVAETRLGFTVDLDAADANGVRPAANLLRLAQQVRGRRLAGNR